MAGDAYVRRDRDGFYYVGTSRVGLASIVYAYRRRESPESIHEGFPVLRLEQIYGAIAFSLARPAVVDAYLARLDAAEQRARREVRPLAPEVRDRLNAAVRPVRALAPDYL